MSFIDDYKAGAAKVDTFVSNVKNGSVFESGSASGASASIDYRILIVAALVVVIMIK